MRNYFIFGEKSSKDFGVYLSGSGTFNAPARDVETIEIPGRNGSLVVDRQRFMDIDVEYPAFILADFAENAQALRRWLLMYPGYQRLEDTYDPHSFRMARFLGPLQFDVRTQNQAGEMTLHFVAKPQRWKKSGEKTVGLENGESLYNDGFPALPLLKVYGNGPGILQIGSTSIQIKRLDGFLMIDCDTQNAYQDTLNKNSSISSSSFPKLEPGKNTIGWNGGITGVEITPRWWTL